MGNIFQSKCQEHPPSNNLQTTYMDDEDQRAVDNAPTNTTVGKNKFHINHEELKARLTPIQYAVTQEKATERAFTGEYNDHMDSGQYHCIVCNESLFSSDTKFPTSCGWPGFKRPISEKNINLTDDYSHNMVRVEVTCSNCGSHLGHVFEDGPLPERTRYCINSAALKFIKQMPK